MELRLRFESKMEAWLESIGKGMDKARRPPAPHMLTWITCAGEAEGPRPGHAPPLGLYQTFWWSTSTNHDANSKAESELYEYDAESWTVTVSDCCVAVGRRVCLDSGTGHRSPS